MEIYCCYGCYHKGTLDLRNHFCRKMDNKKIKVNIFKEIPEWCPLPDASQQQDSADPLCLEVDREMVRDDAVFFDGDIGNK